MLIAADILYRECSILKKLETVEACLKSNAKMVIPAGTELVNIIGEISRAAFAYEER